MEPIATTAATATELDGLTISQLEERYSLSRTSIYTQRFRPLGLVPKKNGRFTYVDREQIELLDRFDACMKRGSGFATCLAEVGVSSDLIPSSKRWDGNRSLPKETPEEILERLERIARVSQSGFILPTSVIAWCYGLSPRTVLSKGSQFSRGGFIVTRWGKFGREVGWTIEREQKLLPTSSSQQNYLPTRK